MMIEMKWGFVLAGLLGPGTFYEFHDEAVCEIAYAQIIQAPIEKARFKCGFYAGQRLEDARQNHQRPRTWRSWLTFAGKTFQITRDDLEACERDTDLLATSPLMPSIAIDVRCIPEPPGQPA